MTKKIAVALSGGVDSSLVAYILKQQRYNIHAFTMKLDEKELPEAKKIADFLDIPHSVIDMRQEFKSDVINYFLSCYENGQTPNPCLVCNRKIKLGALFNKVKSLGFDYLATGHYARIKNNNELHKVDNTKDQSYFLFNIKYENLPYIIFPLADYTKDKVRELAIQAQLPTSTNKDSQDVCFIENDYKDFIKGKIKNPIGNFIDSSGKILGIHEGIANYTIGQRKGLKLGGFANPLFVLKIDASTNNIIVGEQKELLKSKVTIENVNWLLDKVPTEPIEVNVKFRSQQKEIPAIVTPLGNKAVIKIEQPFAGIASGQGACLYQNTRVIGGGFIINDN